MASFIRGKQAGIQSDLSASILPGLFSPDDQARFGVNSQISTLAYDPVQSLLAVGTNETPFGSGQIYIFGQNRVKHILKLSRRASIRMLQFCADRLVSVDSKNEITIWSLLEGNKVAGYTPPGVVAALVTDPMLDWALIGLQNGDVVAYDLDRERLAPLRLPNFWRERNPRARILSVVSMQLHPRDIGQLLIGYTDGAVVYSFKQNKAIKFFNYEVPAGASGGNSDPVSMTTVRKPRLTQALWHPTGTFVVTAYDDASIVFWDPTKPGEARILMARTLQDTHVDKPGGSSGNIGNQPSTFSPKDPYSKIAWCAKENPDDTGLLVAGGQPISMPTKGLTFLEFGQTPVYATSTWQVLSDHFQAKRQHVLPTPPGADIVDFCLIPRQSPHYAGAQDPIAIITVVNSGELITSTFPSGHPISPTNQLHPSLSFVHPFVQSIAVAAVDRNRWLGMTETRQKGPPILKGGAEATHPLRRYEARNIVQVAHGDGMIQIFDAGHADEIENLASLQVDMARALGRYENIEISSMSMAGSTGELAVGTRAGEVVVYKWGGNRFYGREAQNTIETKAGGITDISERSEPTLKEGLQPSALYEMAQGAITALKVSDVGFVGIGSEKGFFSIVDLRGPAVILATSMANLIKQEKRGSFMKKGHGSQGPLNPEWPVVVEFGVMTLEGDEYSSICCFVGTNLGRIATFKILPQPDGRYSGQLAGVTSLDDRIISINPIVAATGKPALASGAVVAGLREGQQVHGTLVVVTESSARIFKPATGKGASKSWEVFICDSACVTNFELHGYALVCVFGDGTTRAFSLPGLKEIGISQLTMFDKTRLSSSIVTPSGDIFGWTGPSEIAMLSVWGTAQPLPRSQDRLFNQTAINPPRPTISNLQWISGTQYVSPTDLDLLIGGPDRPPSKRMMAAALAEERAARGFLSPGRTGTGASGSSSGSQEGWGDWATRQLNERTEKLNIMGDSMDKVEENSAGWAHDANKWKNKQKRNIVVKGITGKFF